jgi:hypothetical protein
MKKRSTLVWFFASALTMLAIVACGKSGSDNGNNVAPVPVNPSLVVPAGTRVGFFAQNSKMDWLYPQSAGFTNYQFQSGMNNVLKYAMRTCDRGAYNGGTSACQSWLSGPNDIMIFANGSQASAVQMVIRSMPDTSCQSPYSCSTYWYSLPNFTQFILGMFGFNSFNNSNIYNPMILNMTIWPVNDSKGFELRGYAPGGDLAYGSGNLLFQFQVANGKLEDAGWDYQLVFNGEVAATGHMVRCQQANCGVQGF